MQALVQSISKQTKNNVMSSAAGQKKLLRNSSNPVLSARSGFKASGVSFADDPANTSRHQKYIDNVLQSAKDAHKHSQEVAKKITKTLTLQDFDKK